MDGLEQESTERSSRMSAMSDASETPASYEAAVERLEEIIDRLDSGQAGLRETLELCREGRELVNYCAGELDAVGEGLKELRLDELAARLDPDSA
jgi:exodeoxyribonuclease VII small subunit